MDEIIGSEGVKFKGGLVKLIDLSLKIIEKAKNERERDSSIALDNYTCNFFDLVSIGEQMGLISEEEIKIYTKRYNKAIGLNRIYRRPKAPAYANKEVA